MAGNTSKPFDVSRMAIGGLGQMLDGMEFVKRAWSSTLNLPGSLVPTVDVEELDKRIADLKAVEQWLEMNLSMLRGTVQALEIQRGTIAAVKAFGATLGQVKPADESEAAAALRRAMAEIAARQSSMAAASAAPATAAAAEPAGSAAPAGAAPRPAAKKAGAARRGSSQPAATEVPLSVPGINPGIWWNLLQQNFNQVAEAALSGVGLQEAAASAIKAVTPRPAAAPPPTTAAEPEPAAAAPAKPRAARKPAASRTGGRTGGAR